MRPYSKKAAREAHQLMERIYPEGLNDGDISRDGFWNWLTPDPEYDPQLMFVAGAADAVVGFCHCWRGAFVKDLAVEAAFRRRGLGTALLTMALLAFKSRGAASVDLKTDIENIKAQSLYLRLGFEIVERVED